MNRNTRNIRKNRDAARRRQELAALTSAMNALDDFERAFRTPSQEKEQILAMLRQWRDGFIPDDAFDRGYAMALDESIDYIESDNHWGKEYLK